MVEAGRSPRSAAAARSRLRRSDAHSTRRQDRDPALIDVTSTWIPQGTELRARIITRARTFSIRSIALPITVSRAFLEPDLPQRSRLQLRAEAPGALFRTAAWSAMPGAGPGGPMRDSAYAGHDEAEARADVQDSRAKRST